MRGFAVSTGRLRWLFLFHLLGLCLLVSSAATAPPPPSAERTAPVPAAERATFAGGCFWCVEAAFEGMAGVLSVTSGFSGGPEKNPTYEMVSSGTTGHAEAVQVVFDPKRISYSRLLDLFWHNIDPTQADGQFCDHGRQYRSAIFWEGETQRRLAEDSKRALEASKRLKRPIVTQIVRFTAFYPAEQYHQDYYKKNPADYGAYRLGCGRDRRLREIWGSAAPAAH